MKVLGVLLGVRVPVIPITIDGRLTILDLCDPIQENAGGRLDGIIASLLRMYAPRREDIALLPPGELDFEIQIGGLPAQAVSLFQNARPLASTEKIQDVLESVVDGGPVCVLAYVPFWQLRQHMGIDDTLIGNLEPYQSVANRLKDSPEVECLEAKLVENAATSYDLVREGRMPFVMLQSSSGTGNTQMAFILQARGTWDVFYIVCGGSSKKDQAVYAPFVSRSRSFRACAEADRTR